MQIPSAKSKEPPAAQPAGQGSPAQPRGPGTSRGDTVPAAAGGVCRDPGCFCLGKTCGSTGKQEAAALEK